MSRGAMARPKPSKISSTPDEFTTAKYLYLALVIIRLACICLPGYIHPDEHFQNPQITAQDLLGLKPAFVPWEYSAETPSRSIIGPYLTTGIGFYILKWLASIGLVTITSKTVLLASRLPLFLLSFASDFAIWSFDGPGRAVAWRGLLLWATSWPALVMLLRPFGNTLITTIFAVSMSLVLSSRPSWWNPVFFGILSSLGVFSHFTYILYLAPLGMLSLVGNISKGARAFLAYYAKYAISLLVSAVACLVADTCYYRNITPSSLTFSNIVITPLNIIKYNMNTDNLSLHGIHPWYLHCTVNMMILLGPGYIYWIVSMILSRGDDYFGKILTALPVVLPLSGLSTSAHQEPRFLLPLAVPVIHYLARRPKSKLFISTWIIFNSALTILFGGLHQAGIVPTMAVLSDILTDNSSVTFYKGYMPPRYLLSNTRKRIHVYDMIGSSAAEMSEHIRKDISESKYLVTTAGLLRRLDLETELVHSQFPHLDLDNLYVDMSNIKESLSLNIYRIK